MERVAFLPWIDIGQQLHEKEQDTGQRRKEQGHVFVGIAVDCPVKAPVGGDDVRHSRQQAGVGQQRDYGKSDKKTILFR